MQARRRRRQRRKRRRIECGKEGGRHREGVEEKGKIIPES